MKTGETARLFSLEETEQPQPYEGDLPAPASPFQARAVAEGADFDAIAFDFMEQAGGTMERFGGEVDGIPVDGLVRGTNGRRFLVAAHGTIDGGPQAGLRRVDTVHKVGHRASMLAPGSPPLLVLTSHLPAAGSKAAFYLARSRAHIFDVIATTGDLAGFLRLTHYLKGTGGSLEPQAALWRCVVRQEQLQEPTREAGEGGRDGRGSSTSQLRPQPGLPDENGEGGSGDA